MNIHSSLVLYSPKLETSIKEWMNIQYVIYLCNEIKTSILNECTVHIYNMDGFLTHYADQKLYKK